MTIAPDADDTAVVAVSGTYSAMAGDRFSAAYKFAVDLNSATPVNYRISGSVSGVPIPDINGSLYPGLACLPGNCRNADPFSDGFYGRLLRNPDIDFDSIFSQSATISPITLDLNEQESISSCFRLPPWSIRLAGFGHLDPCERRQE